MFSCFSTLIALVNFIVCKTIFVRRYVYYLQTTLPLYNFLQVVDKRNVIFKDKLNEIFQGSGQSLGGEARPSRLVPSNLKHGGAGSSAVRTNSARHKVTMAVEQEDGEVKLDVETELPCSCLIVVLLVFKHIKTT